MPQERQAQKAGPPVGWLQCVPAGEPQAGGGSELPPLVLKAFLLPPLVGAIFALDAQEIRASSILKRWALGIQC